MLAKVGVPLGIHDMGNMYAFAGVGGGVAGCPHMWVGAPQPTSDMWVDMWEDVGGGIPTQMHLGGNCATHISPYVGWGFRHPHIQKKRDVGSPDFQYADC